MDSLFKVASFISNVFTILASGIVIYLFYTKRKSIYSVFKLLINYSYQLSLSELKEKLERLNDYNAAEPANREHIINILNEIMGQIRGNEKLKVHLENLLKRMSRLVSDHGRLTEPRKRALVSELREKLRHLNVKNIDDLVGD